MKRKGSMASGIMIGIAAGVTIGALGAVNMPGVVNSRFMKNAKKSFKKNASRTIGAVESFIDCVPKMLS